MAINPAEMAGADGENRIQAKRNIPMSYGQWRAMPTSRHIGSSSFDRVEATSRSACQEAKFSLWSTQSPDT
jgi:hypothetical protein